nr:hypothetical protein [Tanacetum cinerariifolium]
GALHLMQELAYSAVGNDTEADTVTLALIPPLLAQGASGFD